MSPTRQSSYTKAVGLLSHPGRANNSHQRLVCLSLCMLKPAYPHPLPVSAAKFLTKLCKAGTIQRQFHDFYEQLPVSDVVRDCLPEPDYTEDVE